MQPMINALLDPVVNFGKVTVLGGYPAGIDNIAVTLIVGDGSKLPNPADPAGSFNLVWFDSSTYSDPADDPKVEIVRCIANVNNTLTLMRAQEGTSASTKNTSGKIYKMILAPTKKTIDDIEILVNSLPSVVSKTATYTLTTSDDTVLCDASILPFTVYLPDAATTLGRVYTIKKIDNSSNGVTLSAVGLDTIESYGSISIQNQWDYYMLQSIGTGWIIKSSGNVLVYGYFDTSQYATGCSFRDIDTLANMVPFLAAFKIGTLIAQRDLGIQGSGSLGTVALTLSSKYQKTYNVPINGTVSDGTLVRAITDSTTPAVTQTNAAGNYAMFDFADPYGTLISSIDIDPTSGTKAEYIEKCNDRKISVLSNAYYVNPWPTASLTFVVDFGSIQTSKSIFFAWLSTYKALDYASPSASFNLYSSIDNITYGSSLYTHTVSVAQLGSAEKTLSLTDQTFRYLKFALTSSSGNYNWYRMQARELLVR